MNKADNEKELIVLIVIPDVYFGINVILKKLGI